jgi:hypothetical protein
MRQILRGAEGHALERMGIASLEAYGQLLEQTGGAALPGLSDVLCAASSQFCTIHNFFGTVNNNLQSHALSSIPSTSTIAVFMELTVRIVQVSRFVHTNP